jgi:hypothetical protein
MKLVNRSVVIVRPKQPLVDWVNETPEVKPRKKLTLDNMRASRTVLLVPQDTTLAQAREYVDSLKPYLFEMQLNLWYRDPRTWPRERSNAPFDEWFDLELHTLVVDLVDEPLLKEGDEDWED